MLTVALKGIAGHKGRIFSTGLAVVLGVAFMAGTLIFTGTLRGSFNDLFEDVNAGTDAWIRSSEGIEGDLFVSTTAPVGVGSAPIREPARWSPSSPR